MTRERGWRRLHGFVRWSILAACIFYLVRFFWTNRDELTLALQFDPVHLGAVAALFTVYYFVYSYRFQFVLEACSNREIEGVEWFKLLVVGRFLNGLFPQAGNVYRTVRLKKTFGVSHTAYATALASYMWLDMVMNFALALIVVAGFQAAITIWGYRAETILGVSLALGIVVPWLLSRTLGTRVPAKGWLGSVESRIQALVRGSIGFARDLRQLVIFFGLGLLLFGLMAAILRFLFLASGAEMDIAGLAVFYALYRLTVYVTITPGNLGVRELAYGVLSDQMGVGMAEGIVVATILRIASYLVLAVLGVMVGGLDALRSREVMEERGAMVDPDPGSG